MTTREWNRQTDRIIDRKRPSLSPAQVRRVLSDRIVRGLWKNGERYHAGAIERTEWSTRNHELWHEAELAGVANDVMRELRKNR